jgi:type II secretory pathway component GspD/PulD (secretin)
MNKILTSCAVGFGIVVAATTYAADNVTLSAQSMTVPEFLRTFFSHLMKAPYQIDPSVIDAHANDKISLRYEEPLTQDELYERVSDVLRAQYGVEVTRTSHGYTAHMAE